MKVIGSGYYVCVNVLLGLELWAEFAPQWSSEETVISNFILWFLCLCWISVDDSKLSSSPSSDSSQRRELTLIVYGWYFLGKYCSAVEKWAWFYYVFSILLFCLHHVCSVFWAFSFFFLPYFTYLSWRILTYLE